jgi:hypothetical protein
MRMASVISFPFREAVADVEYKGKIGILRKVTTILSLDTKDFIIYSRYDLAHEKDDSHKNIMK